jgi:hypothetical protein
MTALMETSVIIANYNGKQYLHKCITALLRQTYRGFEIIIVDNGSKDGSVAFVQETFGKECASGKIRVITNKENTGFTGGNNIGVRKARGKYMALLNNDTQVDKGWLAALIQTLKDYPDIAIIGSFENPTVPLNRLFFIEQECSTTMTLCEETVLIPRKDAGAPHLRSAFFVSGNGMAFRKKEIPLPFDDNYFAYAEDVHLGWRQRMLGKSAAFNMQARMVHYGAGTKKQDSHIGAIAIFNGTKNQLMNFLIFYEWKNIIRIAPLFVLTQLGHIVQNPHKFIVKLKAYFWIIANLRRVMAKRKAIQAQRKIPDRELIKLMSCQFCEPMIAEEGWRRRAVNVANSVFYVYCFVMRLRTTELVRNTK